MSVSSVSTDPLDALTNQFTRPVTIPFANRIPTTLDVYPANTVWQYTGTTPPTLYVTTGAGNWVSDSASSASTITAVSTNATFYPLFASATSGNLGINVNSSLTYNPSTTTLSVPVATHSGSSGSLLTPLSISNAGAGGVSFAIGASTNTATISLSSTPSQPLTFSTGGSAAGFTFNNDIEITGTGNGLFFPATVVSGASPQTCNARVGIVTFTGVSIAAGATQSFVINNTTIAAIGTVILYSMTGSTTGSALSIQSYTNVAATSSTIVVTNGTGATTSTANITFTFLVIN